MLNKTMLIGNLGADVETRYTKGEVAVANFRVATTEKWKDAQGNQQEATEWHRIVAFGRLAEICSEYLVKGSKVYVEGRSQTRKWEDSNGITRFTTEIIAREMKMLGGGDNPCRGAFPRPGCLLCFFIQGETRWTTISRCAVMNLSPTAMP